MSNQFNSSLIQIFKTLSLNPRLNFYSNDKVSIKLRSGKPIFDCSASEFTTPIERVKSIFSFYKSPLYDSKIDYSGIERLIKYLTNKDLIIRLNHVGICYKTESQSKEREQLVQETQPTNLHLYEEPSNDKGLWLFLGDTNTWDDPLLELLPVENTSDQWVDYWLPHFHIDIDTKLSCEEIEDIITTFFSGKIKPFRVTVIEGTVYCVRARLGINTGININLDIATRSRNVEYARKQILQKLA